MTDKTTPRAEKPLLVMVVDDQPEMREFLRVRLEMEGIWVSTAANGQEAVALARALRPAVVILDLDMPIMDGRQAIPLLRSIDETARIVIHGGPTDAELTGTLRPDAVVPKGAHPSLLLDTIRLLSLTSRADPFRLKLPPIPLPQALHAFDGWVGLNARIKESEAPEVEAAPDGLESLTKIFFELGLQLLSATQRRSDDVVLEIALHRGTAERALRALETIRTRGFDTFYAVWGYRPTPEAAVSLHQLSDLLTSALIEVTIAPV